MYSVRNYVPPEILKILNLHDPGGEVIPGLYIGSISTACDYTRMAELGIGAILNLSQSGYDTIVPKLDIDMNDAPMSLLQISDYYKKFKKGADFIKIAVHSGLPVLVHCAAGINRSAAQIAFYLISIGYSYAEAIKLLETANNGRCVPMLTNQSFRYFISTVEYFGTDRLDNVFLA